MNDIPIVSIIGSQNVGKSTIFNRLIKSKKAIIHSTAGVTRDLVSEIVNLNGIYIKLIDSGGFSDEKDETNQLVQKKTIEAIRESDLILFVVESGNCLPIEKEYINIIRKSGKTVYIIMNKSDSPDKDYFINEFYSYGLGKPLPVSAEHNRNIDELKKLISDSFKDNENKNIKSMNKEFPDIKISILGKPNVGKSSLLNKIVNKERSIVSSIAGTTRDIVDEQLIFEEKKILILDTAGIRKKTKVNENLEYYSVNRAIKSIEIADIILLVLDSTFYLSDQDKKIADQIVKNGKGLIIVLNKWDLQEKGKNTFEKIKENLKFKFPILNYVQIIPVSALNGIGIKKILKTSIKIFEELHKKIETHQLNEFIQKVIKNYSPGVKGGYLKIYYGIQKSIAPVEFIFFINKKKLLTDNYEQYLINRMREYFGFSGIPIKVYFRDRKK